MAVLRRRLYRAIVHALHIGRELVEAGDGARRLLIRRFELLALGGVLVDLAELVFDVRTDTNDNGGGKAREYRCPARHRIVPYTSIRKTSVQRATAPASAMYAPTISAIPLSHECSTSASPSSRSTPSPATSR